MALKVISVGYFIFFEDKLRELRYQKPSRMFDRENRWKVVGLEKRRVDSAEPPLENWSPQVNHVVVT